MNDVSLICCNIKIFVNSFDSKELLSFGILALSRDKLWTRNMVKNYLCRCVWISALNQSYARFLETMYGLRALIV